MLPAAVAIVNPHRDDATYPDPGLSGSGVAFTVARLLLGELPARRPRRSTWLTSPRSAPWRTWPRSSARTGRSPGSAWSGCGRRPRPGLAALLERAGRGAGGGRPRDRRLRPRAAPERRGPGGGGAGCRPPAAGGDTRGGREAGRRSWSRRTRPGAISCAPRSRRPGPPSGSRIPGRPQVSSRCSTCPRSMRHPSSSVAGPVHPRCSSAVRGRSGSSASSPAGSRTRRAAPAVVGDPAGPGSAGLVPGRRAARSCRHPDGVRRTCSSVTGVMRLPPASSCRQSAGRRSWSGSSPSRQTPRPTIREPPCRWTWRCRPHTSTTRCSATWPASRRAAPATPSRSWPSWASRSSVSGRPTAATRSSCCGGIATCWTGSPSAGPTWPQTLVEGDRVDVVARLASRTFGGLETLQLEVRDVSASGAHPRSAQVLERAAGRAGASPVGPGRLAAVPGGTR